jgi:toxin ParE1/3/4
MFPEANPSREQLGAGLRVLFNGNYAIYYVLSQSAVTIVRVLHGARDVAAIADRGGFSSR